VATISPARSDPTSAVLARGEPRPEDRRRVRSGTAGLWAVLGLIAIAIAGQAWIRWVLSPTQFSPAPLHNADHYASGRLIALRVTEALSAIVFVWLAWKTIVEPLRRDRRLGIDGKIALGCLLGCVTDGVLNLYKYIFAWNAHSINLGSWSSFLPLHSSSSDPRYAEALIWGVPMYVYFCIGVAIAGCAVIGRLRRGYPAISDVAALSVVYVLACVFDFVVENAIIRSTQAYAFARTPASVTLWAGSGYQFPIYEMLFVAALGTIFTAVRLSAIDATDGVSTVERGFERFRPRLQAPVRMIAVIGFSMTTLLVVYHLGVNWLGTNGDSVARLPSYLLP
jgi:hypothetical protein